MRSYRAARVLATLSTLAAATMLAACGLESEKSILTDPAPVSEFAEGQYMLFDGVVPGRDGFTDEERDRCEDFGYTIPVYGTSDAEMQPVLYCPFDTGSGMFVERMTLRRSGATSFTVEGTNTDTGELETIPLRFQEIDPDLYLAEAYNRQKDSHVLALARFRGDYIDFLFLPCGDAAPSLQDPDSRMDRCTVDALAPILDDLRDYAANFGTQVTIVVKRTGDLAR